MKQIKFRAWCEGSKEMYYPDDNYEFLIDNNSVGFYPRYDKDSFYRFNTIASENEREIKVMQFTGLKDKNGAEIYEGDIVKESDIIMKVKWFDKFSCFCLVSSDWMFPHFFGEASDPDNCEVIGNIYQNPELVSETKQ